MEEQHTGVLKTTVKVLAVLIVFGLTEQWWPTLASLVVAIALLAYARYTWRTLAALPARQVAELTAIGALALAAGFFAKYGVGRLVVTGVVLALAFALWRLARADEREAADPPGASDGP